MTTEIPNQANGAPNGAAGGSAAGTADLDALLGEYSGKAKPETKPSSVDLAAIEPVINFAKSEMTKRASEAFENDVKLAIDFVKEEEAVKDMPVKVIRGLLELYGVETPEFVKAFENRGKDQNTWKAQLADARKFIASELKPLVKAPDRVASDVLAARAAVAGGNVVPPPSGQQYTPQELFNMTDQQYNAVMRAEAAKARR